jgi:hypothetical protein
MRDAGSVMCIMGFLVNLCWFDMLLVSLPFLPRQVRGLRFSQYGRKQRVMHTVCERIVSAPGDNRPVVVAYGAADFSATGWGQPPAPVVGVRRALQRRHRVAFYAEQEHYTSQRCSDDHSKLVPMRDEGGQNEIYGVRRCEAAGCRKTWNRDVNAARNMRKIFMAEATTGTRPVLFTHQGQRAH